jgi:hypothetical protein
METKEELLKRITPLAVLRAITAEAKDSIIKSCLGEGVIGIWKYPFHIGRESRLKDHDRKNIISTLQNALTQKPVNDIYLIDDGEYLQISRKHLQIEKKQGSYLLTDLGSACGTIVNKTKIGNKHKEDNSILKDGDIIQFGTPNSPYIFEFIVLD